MVNDYVMSDKGNYLLKLHKYFQVKEILQHNKVLIDDGVQLNAAMRNTAGMRSWVETLNEATKLCVCENTQKLCLVYKLNAYILM